MLDSADEEMLVGVTEELDWLVTDAVEDVGDAVD